MGIGLGTAALIGGGLAAGGSIASGLFAADAAEDAADTAADAQMQQYMMQRRDMLPWMEAGEWALGQPAGDEHAFNAKEYLAMYPDVEQDWRGGTAEEHYRMYGKAEGRHPSFAAQRGDPLPEGTGLMGMIQAGPGEFVPEEQPGYRFGYEEFVEKPTLRSASAMGRSRSGATQKALTKYASNYASTEYDKWLGRYYDRMKPLQSLANVGQTSSSNMAAIAPNTAPYQYAGQMNQTNALLAGFSGAGSALQQGLNFYSMQNPQQGSYGNPNYIRPGSGYTPSYKRNVIMPSGNALRTDYIRDIGAQYQPVQNKINALTIRGMEQDQQHRAQMQPIQQQAAQLGVDQAQMSMEQARAEKEKYSFKNEGEVWKWFDQVKAHINPGNYESFKNTAVFRGINPELFPEAAAFQGPGGQQKLQEFLYSAERMREQFKAKSDLTRKNIQEEDFQDSETGEWMTKKSRFNPQSGEFEEYSTGPKFAKSKEERMKAQLLRNKPMVQSFLKRKGPMATYADKWKMNDDGTLYEDAEGVTVRLPSFWKATGKRGNIKHIIAAGEQLDDAIEVMELLQDPEVQREMQSKANETGMVERVKGMTRNQLRKWAQQRGIGENTKAYEVLIRLQRMASEERKRLLGAAVTITELQSIVSWLPDAGDNFDSIVAKMNVGVYEATEGLMHWLDAFKHDADMSSFYRAFGWDRFNMPSKEQYQIRVGGQQGQAGRSAPTRQQLGDQIQQEHPDWSKKQIAIEILRREAVK